MAVTYLGALSHFILHFVALKQRTVHLQTKRKSPHAFQLLKKSGGYLRPRGKPACWEVRNGNILPLLINNWWGHGEKAARYF